MQAGPTRLPRQTAMCAMTVPPRLEGTSVRLDPLGLGHVEALLAAARLDPALYRWTTVPQTADGMRRYVEAALADPAAIPFAIVRAADDAIVGCTRYFDLETWAWPTGHPRALRAYPDVSEIGYTWLSQPAIRTRVNTEVKTLMLTHAFEVWEVLRVCLQTDARNERSRAAIERIGGRFEGILRAHRLAPDMTVRDSARYSITAAEWPEVKAALLARLDRS